MGRAADLSASYCRVAQPSDTSRARDAPCRAPRPQTSSVAPCKCWAVAVRARFQSAKAHERLLGLER